MAVILGINAFHVGAAAALVVDGVPVAAIPEERINRIKNYGGFPRHAIVECLRIAGIDFKDVDIVTIGRNQKANLAQKTFFALRHPGRLPNLVKIRRSGATYDHIMRLISSQCGVDESSLKFQVEHVEHHLAHTASAYFTSPWESATGLTIDGSGDFVTSMVTSCSGPNIQVLEKRFIPNSLGFLYTAICQFIGFRQVGDEGKVMGLAPLGSPKLVNSFRSLGKFDRDSFRIQTKYFQEFGANQGMTVDDSGVISIAKLFSHKLEEKYGPPRESGDKITQRDKDLAYALQNFFERAYIGLVNRAHNFVPKTRIAIAGGCALNSVANGKIFAQTPFTSTWIQPAAGDDGLALGSALYVAHSRFQGTERWAMDHSYLGPAFTEIEYESALCSSGVVFSKLSPDTLLETCAESLARGEIVGWFQGRMEWGPRALGNRSILAHPGLPNMKAKLNSRIKHREDFRPFAPAVLADRQQEIFSEHHPSPFMLHVYEINKQWRDRLCAVTHVDNTGRLQSVTAKENPMFYRLIQRFEKITGIPVLLNTSFNENEPIICKPQEAINCFRRTKIDVLVMGSYFCRKASLDERSGPHA
jgi:carbamoyltransferase